jgi:hypothetical protein
MFMNFSDNAGKHMKWTAICSSSFVNKYKNVQESVNKYAEYIRLCFYIICYAYVDDPYSNACIL